jgi:hypothetical protein
VAKELQWEWKGEQQMLPIAVLLQDPFPRLAGRQGPCSFRMFFCMCWRELKEAFVAGTRPAAGHLSQGLPAGKSLAFHMLTIQDRQVLP